MLRAECVELARHNLLYVAQPYVTLSTAPPCLFETYVNQQDQFLEKSLYCKVGTIFSILHASSCSQYLVYNLTSICLIWTSDLGV